LPELVRLDGYKVQEANQGMQEEGCMQRTLSWAAGLVAAATAFGCSHGTRAVNEINMSSREPVTVQVTNSHVQDVNVFAVNGGERLRLGLVTTGQTQNFQVPTSFTHGGTDLQILVHPVGGGGDYLSGKLMVSPGEEVNLNVAPVINQSSYSVSQAGDFADRR